MTEEKKLNELELRVPRTMFRDLVTSVELDLQIGPYVARDFFGSREKTQRSILGDELFDRMMALQNGGAELRLVPDDTIDGPVLAENKR